MRQTEISVERSIADTSEKPAEQAAQIMPKKKPSMVLRIVTVAAVLFTAWHVFASFLWIAPASPLRDVVPGNTLSKYMLPMFGQSWSVFAPEPINGDNRMLVRAVLSEDGKEHTTEWLNVTDVESQLLTRQLFPARAGNHSIDLASSYRSAYAKLSAEQKETVNLGFFEGDNWASRVTQALYDQGDNHSAINGYINAEFRAVRYSTQVARAIWGENVIRVQFQMERQNVIPFKERNNPEAQRPATEQTPSGWRGLQVAAGQSEKDFADTFKRLYEELQK